MNRRQLLTTVAAPVLFVALTAGSCQTTTSNVPAQIVTDIANAVSALLTAFQAVMAQNPTAMPADKAATITAALTQAKGLLANLSSSLSANQGAPVVQQIEQALNTVITTAASVPLIPPPFNIALAAASVVLPIIEAWLNSVLPASALAIDNSVAAARVKLMAVRPMSVPQAEAWLAQNTH